MLPTPSRPAAYRIVVRGGGAAGWSAWIGATAVDNGDGTVTLTTVVDQAALRGILGRLWDLNATLISAAWVPRDPFLAEGAEEGAEKVGTHDE